MRELAVFYCPKCGHYAYYQTSRHPQCPKCGTQEAMHMVRMHYSEFMRMSCDERDEFLSREILKTNPSLITRLTEPHKRYNSREIIAEMNNVIMNLDTENKILSDTVKWMHDTIWELMHEKREYGQSNGTAPGDCGGYRDFRDYGNCRDREPSEECMEVTAHTGQTEAAYSEAAAADMSQTEEAEKGYKR